MNFQDNDIHIEPGHQTRRWQSADYFVGRTHLFHERTYVNSIPAEVRYKSKMLEVPGVAHWAAGGSIENCAQWFSGRDAKDKIEALAQKHGGRAHEEFYPADEAAPLYFLAFNDNEKALAFCRTKDFDALCLTMEKIAEGGPPTATGTLVDYDAQGESGGTIPRPGSVTPPLADSADHPSPQALPPDLVSMS